MKTIMVTLAALGLAGCMASPESINAKAQYPDAGTGESKFREMGQLAVRTEADEIRFREAKEPNMQFHPSYVIYDQNGRRVKEVRNRLYADDHELTRTDLAPGRYLVKLWHPMKGEAETFWVKVERDELTFVDADRVWSHSEPPREPRVPPTE